MLGTPPVRGRAAELTAIHDALATLGPDGGAVIVIDGPPGIGKSRLLAEAEARARETGVRVLRGDAFGGQRSVPYAPLLAAALDADPPVVDADSLWPPGVAAHPRFRLVHELRAALARAASRGPLLVALDDLHEADDATLSALPSLVTGLARLPVLWLAALRARPAHAGARELLTRLERAGAVRLRLEALDAGAVATIVTEAAGGEATPELLRLAEHAQGYPSLLVELLRGWREEGGPAGEAVPRRLAVAMRERLDRLTPDTRELLCLAAVLPERFTATQLARMLHRPASSLLGAFEEALRADVLVEDGDRLRFRHDLVREATHAALPESVRRALLKEAVAVLWETGAPRTQIADQLAASAEPGDRQAVTTLRKAARTLASSDPAAAAELIVKAIELSTFDDPERGSLIADGVELLHRASRAEQARELADTALGALLAPRQEAQVRLSLSTMSVRSTAERARENRRALELPGVDRLTRARHQGWLAYNLAMSGDTGGAEAAVTTALADEIRDPQARTLATVAHCCLLGARGEWAAALAELERLLVDARSRPREPYLAVPEFHHANLLAVLGRVDDARRAVGAGLARAQQERGSRSLAFWHQLAGLVNLAGGNLTAARSEAEADAEAAPFGAERPASGSFTGTVRILTLAQVGTHTGDRRLVGEIARAAREAHRHTSGSARTLAARVLAAEALRAGEPAEADRWLAEDPVLGAGPMLPLDLDQLRMLANVAIACPRSTLTERLCAAVRVLERADPGVPVIAAVAVHLRGLLEREPVLLVDAADRLRDSSRPLLFAAAAQDAGVALAGARRGAAAVELLNQAFDTYRQHGAEASARQVGRVLRGLGAERRAGPRDRPLQGLSSLTESELKVVRLVARGATNRAVADQMVISPHTVSTHLRRAFAKLDVHSRTQLAHLLHAAE